MHQLIKCLPVEITAALITVAGGIIGFLIGYQIWKTQFIKQKKHEITLSFLKSLTQYHRAFSNVRNGSYIIYDVSEYEKYFFEDWSTLVARRATFEEEYILIKALIGNKSEANMRRLVLLQNELLANFQTYVRKKVDGAWIGDVIDMETEKIIFQKFSSTDDFEEKIKTEIESINEQLKPYLLK